MCTLRDIDSKNGVIMTSHYVIVSIKLSLEDGNDEYVVQCNFDGHSMTVFEVIEGGRASKAPRSQEATRTSP